jgi:hypothetical protein
VAAAVATELTQVHGAFHLSEPGREDRVAGLVGSALDAKAPTTELQHLGHERETIESPVLIECAEDLVCGPDLHQISCAVARRSRKNVAEAQSFFSVGATGFHNAR